MDYRVKQIAASAVGSAGAIIVAPFYVGNLDRFSVTCITSATLAVNYSIQLSPYESEGFVTAGANFTATSVPAASGADAVVSNQINNNHFGFVRIQASAVSLTTTGDLRFVIHGFTRNRS